MPVPQRLFFSSEKIKNFLRPGHSGFRTSLICFPHCRTGRAQKGYIFTDCRSVIKIALEMPARIISGQGGRLLKVPSYPPRFRALSNCCVCLPRFEDRARPCKTALFRTPLLWRSMQEYAILILRQCSQAGKRTWRIFSRPFFSHQQNSWPGSFCFSLGGKSRSKSSAAFSST